MLFVRSKTLFQFISRFFFLLVSSKIWKMWSRRLQFLYNQCEILAHRQRRTTHIDRKIRIPRRYIWLLNFYRFRNHLCHYFGNHRWCMLCMYFASAFFLRSSFSYTRTHACSILALYAWLSLSLSLPPLFIFVKSIHFVNFQYLKFKSLTIDQEKRTRKSEEKTQKNKTQNTNRPKDQNAYGANEVVWRSIEPQHVNDGTRSNSSSICCFHIWEKMSWVKCFNNLLGGVRIFMAIYNLICCHHAYILTYLISILATLFFSLVGNVRRGRKEI